MPIAGIWHHEKGSFEIERICDAEGRRIGLRFVAGASNGIFHHADESIVGDLGPEREHSSPHYLSGKAWKAQIHPECEVPASLVVRLQRRGELLALTMHVGELNEERFQVGDEILCRRPEATSGPPLAFHRELTPLILECLLGPEIISFSQTCHSLDACTRDLDGARCVPHMSGMCRQPSSRIAEAKVISVFLSSEQAAEYLVSAQLPNLQRLLLPMDSELDEYTDGNKYLFRALGRHFHHRFPKLAQLVPYDILGVRYFSPESFPLSVENFCKMEVLEEVAVSGAEYWGNFSPRDFAICIAVKLQTNSISELHLCNFAYSELGLIGTELNDITDDITDFEAEAPLGRSLTSLTFSRIHSDKSIVLHEASEFLKFLSLLPCLTFADLGFTISCDDLSRIVGLGIFSTELESVSLRISRCSAVSLGIIMRRFTLYRPRLHSIDLYVDGADVSFVHDFLAEFVAQGNHSSTLRLVWQVRSFDMSWRFSDEFFAHGKKFGVSLVLAYYRE